MAKILLIEDAVDTQYLVAAVIGRAHRLICVATIAEARDQLLRGSFDLLLLDVMLPDGDGFKFCSELKTDARFSEIPVLFLSGRSHISDKELGFSLGAEDYVSKPFDPRELRARIEARLRKLQSLEQRDQVFRRGNIMLHVGTQKAYVLAKGRETQLDLTPLEFRLLLFFAKHEEQVFSREQLIDTVWGRDLHVLDRTVDAHVSNLRRKISDSSHTVKSVYGVGYSFAQAGSEQQRSKEVL